MTEEQIQKLIKMVETADIAELEVSKWGRKVRISKYPTGPSYAFNPPPAPAPVVPTSSSGNSASEEKPGPPVAARETIKSPMVGTFYRSPAPDADPYLKVGDVVKKGQVLCIIEAMKLMNEVEAEFDFKVVEILVENAQAVEYNQPILAIEKM